ncbi:hypothetical protein AVP41_03082 [Microbacterium sp. TNHR37B]|nr:hypothetical protein AVP41_03082 [Microbacterium sp. TNHR37B]
MKMLRALLILLCAASAVALTSCSPAVTERSLGVTADEVASLQLYQYPWGEVPDPLRQLTLDQAEPIALFVKGVTHVPLTALEHTDPTALVGKETQGVRFILKDGRSFEVTTMWVGPHDVIVFWPDGTVWNTVWGSPGIFEAYEEVGVVEEVPASERPLVAFPPVPDATH